jgi:hypothetical protein
MITGHTALRDHLKIFIISLRAEYARKPSAKHFSVTLNTHHFTVRFYSNTTTTNYDNTTYVYSPLFFTK